MRVCLSLLFADSVQFFSAFSHCQNAHPLCPLESSLVFCLVSSWVSSLYFEPGTPFPSNLPHPGHNGKNGYAATQVYDDATDWYSEAANPWLSEKQREEVRPIFWRKWGRFWLCLQGWKQHYQTTRSYQSFYLTYKC